MSKPKKIRISAGGVTDEGYRRFHIDNAMNRTLDQIKERVMGLKVAVGEEPILTTGFPRLDNEMRRENSEEELFEVGEMSEWGVPERDEHIRRYDGRLNIDDDDTITSEGFSGWTPSAEDTTLTDQEVSKLRFNDVIEEMLGLYSRKNKDYGGSFDESLDDDGLLVAKIRIKDKLNRFSQLIDTDAEVKDESIRDTLIDLANYSVMTINWLDLNNHKEED